MATYVGPHVMQPEIQQLVGLKFSIARWMGGIRNFHFGNIREDEKGSYGQYALHIGCPWRIESAAGIVTGSSDLWQWAFADRNPLGWNYEEGTSLQDLRIGELLKGYDSRTRSYVNATDHLVVESVLATPHGDVTLSLSGGYRLIIFPTSMIGESWRLLGLDENWDHLVFGEDFTADTSAATNNIISQVPHLQAGLHYQRGRTLETQGDDMKAIEQYSQAISLKPDFAAAYYQRAGAYQSLDELQHALEDINEAIRLYGKREFYEAYTLKGYIRMDLEDSAGAIDDLTQAIRLARPHASLAHRLRGDARELSGDLMGAIEDYSVVLDDLPDDALVLYSRGEIYQRQGDFQRALADFDEAIRIDPAQWFHYQHRGLVHAARGDNQLAVADYQQALALFSESDADADLEAKRRMQEFIAVHLSMS